MPYYIHHSCMSMYSTLYKWSKFVSVVNMFPLADPFTTFFLLVLVLFQPMGLVYLPEYRYQSQKIKGY